MRDTLGYRPIENYGVIGNMRTVALVGIDGSIDWFCFPRFDSPSVFGSVLDDNKGGHFKIAPVGERINHKQLYWPETNVLVTRFLSEDGVGELTDFMPILTPEQEDDESRLVRLLTVVRGTLRFRVECRPGFDYGRQEHRTEISAEGAIFESDDLSLALTSDVPLTATHNGAGSEFTLSEGASVCFVLRSRGNVGMEQEAISIDRARELFTKTVDFWRRWLSQCTYTGRWREMVHRSALVLKLLHYEPTGALVAAPTCSLPESIGGGRNWDYRFTWMRDAAFTLYALIRIGFTDEAAQFMKWLEQRLQDLNPDGSLQIMYGIDGRRILTEEILDHLEGYRGSGPVRVGNGAYDQLQLDIYGELMDSVYLYNKYGSPISYDLWTHLRRLTDWVCDNWNREDQGIWEVRGGPRHFVYSKVMCWVAVDRALRLAEKRSFPADRARWHGVRDEIYETIMSRGWSQSRKSFVQSLDGDTLDAATLMMPLVFFVSPTDPKMLSTIDAINRSPMSGGLVSNSLVYRYDLEKAPDGLAGDEGTFNMCTFWLVEAMTRAGKFDRARLDEARLMFEQMLSYASHLGLYAEEIGQSGDALGNFPQAFTHLALISAAFNLDRALGSGR